MQSQSSMHLNFLDRNASIFWREINPKPSSCAKLKKLLEMYAMNGNWENVINLSSRAVLHLNKNYERCEFYYIWICALNETNDTEALLHLAKHLSYMGREYSIFNCLAIIAYNFANEQNICLNLLKNQKKYHNIKNKYYKEALALFLTSLNTKRHIQKGIFLFKKMCSNKNVGYLTWRNCLRVLSQHNYEKSMSRIYNLMHIRFPSAHEPYITSALIAMNEKKWNESIRLLKQIIKDNPENNEAILALAHSYEENNEFDKAYELITANSDLFHEQDYDYNFLMARLLSYSAKEKESKEDAEESILFYEKAISLANFFKFPIKKLEELCNEIILFNKNVVSKHKLTFTLETFLQKNTCPSIAQITSFERFGKHLKLNLK